MTLVTNRRGAGLLTLAGQRYGDPGLALSTVDELLAAAPGDVEVVCLAHWVRGLMLHELDQTLRAAEEFEVAAELAHGAGCTDTEARSRASLAIVCLHTGDAVAGREQLERAKAVVPRSAQGFVALLGALFDQRAGRHDGALAGYALAEPLLAAAGDHASLGGLHLNRGVLFIYRDDMTRAHRELALAERIADAHNLLLLSAMAAHNLGYAEGRRGRLADALAALARARARYELAGTAMRHPAVLHTDRAEVLLSAGLADDARVAAEMAVEQLGAAGNVADLTEARLMLARAHLALHDWDDAKRHASAAARGFRQTQRPLWVALAMYVALQADLGALDQTKRPPERLLARCERMADPLLRAGWPVEARDVHTWAARLALARDDLARARYELDLARAIKVRGAAAHRANLWYAEALALVHEGDRNAARAALRRGIAEVHRIGSFSGSTEVRAESMRFTSDLAQLGVDLALATQGPTQVFAWAERQRATTLQFARVEPPAESTLTADLARLRGELANDRPVVVAGRPGQRRGAPSPTERSIREQALSVRSVAERVPSLSLPALRAALGEATLIEFVASADVLYAVVVSSTGARLVAIGSAQAAVDAKDFLLFGLRRLAIASNERALRALASVERARAELDRCLFGSLALDDGPVVVVPTGPLHGTPWAALPSLAGRDVTVVPSAAMWLRAASRAVVARERMLFISGPELPGALAEVSKLADDYRDVVTLTGAQATVAASLVEIERANLVQIAAHGRFRADSPMFSHLRLWDGPLTLYDLERLRAAPEVVVLSACEAASVRVYAGDELLGTATALLRLGVRTIVAPVLAVPDEPTMRMMIAMHTYLRGGDEPARALRRASSDLWAGGTPHDIATASSFVTIGAS